MVTKSIDIIIKKGSHHFTEKRPFISYENSDWRLDNGEKPPAKKYFDSGSVYNEKTRTFTGSVSWKSCSL